MTILERELLFIISRLRCLTENQVNRLYNRKKDSKKKVLKRTLRRMCNDYILVKFPCNINYRGYRDNSYVYYISGSEFYKGEELVKALIASDIVVKMKLYNFEIVRFYRNINIGDDKYYLYLEYINPVENKIKQLLVDIELENKIDFLKYQNLEINIKKSTIPFFMKPNILIVANNIKGYNYLENINNKNIFFTDASLNSILKYL